MQTKAKTGVILANLGTPDAPTAAAVKRYLWQFLTDPRVVDMPKWQWYPLLAGMILPKRAKRVAEHYRQIWTEQGSPLLAVSRRQQQALQAKFDAEHRPIRVELGMTYGNPSMRQAVDKLLQHQVERIIVLPLFPQHSGTTTGALFDAFAAALKPIRNLPPLAFIHSYPINEYYIQALADSINARLKPDTFLLFSYHGIPQRYEQEGDGYRRHCEQTTQAVVQKLGLAAHRWGMAFQSRFGKEEWLKPYTDGFLAQAPARGIDNIAVICPGFAADCLETLEEIEQENRQIFLAHGGKHYQYLLALNDSAAHIDMMAALILAEITP